MAELLNCPFCGSDFLMGQEPHDNHPVAGQFYLYHRYGAIGSAARSCPIEVRGHFDTAAEAIAAWNRRSGVEGREATRRGIYIASKVAHAARWRKLRLVGYPIISTWIDEAGAGESKDLNDLWQRCIREASSAEVLVLNRDPNEVLKGGWIELGAALAAGVPVMAVGIEEFTVAHDKRIRHFPSIAAIMEELKPMADGVPFRTLKDNTHGA